MVAGASETQERAVRPPHRAAGKRHWLLMVEDDEDEAELMRSAFEEVRLPVGIRVAGNAEQCIRCLREEEPRPELVVVDLDRPGTQARALLTRLKQEEQEFRHLPVLIFTTGDDPYAIHECYRDHAAACLVKPMDLSEYRKMAEGVYSFWFELSTLSTQR